MFGENEETDTMIQERYNLLYKSENEKQMHKTRAMRGNGNAH